MAYSPIEQGRLPTDGALAIVAKRHAASIPQVALAWALRSLGVVAIPKAASVAHVHENAEAADISLTADHIGTIDVAFPKPTGKVRLAML